MASPDGFTLIEVMVAIVLLGLIAAGLGGLFLPVLRQSDEARQRSAAVALADQALDTVRALQPADIIAGRDKASVQTEWNSPFPGVDLSQTVMAYDPNAAAGSGPTAALPTTGQQMVVNNRTYTLSWYVGNCYQPAGGGSCTTSNVSGDVTMYRVIVAVSWQSYGGLSCSNGSNTCDYVTSTLVNTSPDPLFNTNQT